jgi:hypothetical protein
VSGGAQSNGRTKSPDEAAGVLANLPRTRPQRATARRAAARGKEHPASAADNGSAATATQRAAKKPKAAGKPAKTAKAGASAGRSQPAARSAAPRPRKAATKRAKPAPEDVPRQGFECEEERATGSVPPPGGTELIGTAAEIVGELAKAGISGGERLLRDVLSRLGR